MNATFKKNVKLVAVFVLTILITASHFAVANPILQKRSLPQTIRTLPTDDNFTLLLPPVIPIVILTSQGPIIIWL